MKLLTLAAVPLLATALHADLIWTVGLPGDAWPQDGTAGGPETVFVQEAGSNDLPGDPASPVENQQSDDDYYFAGVYDTVLDGGNYEPVGNVPENEVGAERAFAGTDNTLRYHFNFPTSIAPATPMTISWDANNLHEAGGADPRYGVEVYVNGTLVGEETVIRPAELGEINTTPAFTLAEVGGEVGEGFDNYVELRGINYSAEGGGNWMGIDHVSLDAELNRDGIVVASDVTLAGLTGAAQTFDLAISNASPDRALTVSQIDVTGDDAASFTITTAVPFTVDPSGQQMVSYTFDPQGDLGMVSASFVITSDDPANGEVTVVLAGTIHDPMLAPVANVDLGESETMISLPLDISNAGLAQDLVIESITFTGNSANSFSATNPGTIAAGATGQANVTFMPPADPGTYTATLVITSNDPVSPVTQITVTATVPRPGTLLWTVGLPGDGWPQNLGSGGGPETAFVQESGANELPGEPDNPVANQQSDDDYYFAGVYTTILDGGNYEPVGPVAANEPGAERAFAGADNSLRYHFNLPSTVGISTPLTVSWDAFNLQGDQEDPRYGVEVYFNGILVSEETLIRSEQLGVINSTDSFTLNDVNGRTGEGFDNYVELRGINYNGDGGGNWMGIDHVSLVALPDEFFEITGIEREGGNVDLTWLSRPGRYYAVDTSSDLVTWSALVSAYPDGGSTGNATSYTDTDVPMDVSEADRYYRVRQVPAPALYSTDFEDGAEGWMGFADAGDTTWELGTPNAEGITAANSGTQAWGTNLAGNYTPDSRARLRSPIIDISNASPRVSLEFSYFNDTPEDVEGTLIRFLDENGGELIALTDLEDIITGQTEGWQRLVLPIPPEALGGMIMIEFEFLSDPNDDVGAGIYLDDVLID